MAIPPSPPLDDTISAGQVGHRIDHQVIAETLNELESAAGMTPAEIAADPAFTDTYAPLVVPVETETGTAYTVVATDNGKVKRFTDAALVTVTLPDGLAVGTLVHLLFTGAAGGAVQDNGTSTVNGEGTVAQHGEASCLVSATDTWHVQGTS